MRRVLKQKRCNAKRQPEERRDPLPRLPRPQVAVDKAVDLVVRIDELIG